MFSFNEIELMKNNNLRSRREFFKVAVHKVLPVIGLISITNIPLFGISGITNDLSCNNGCTGTCTGMCVKGCVGACMDNCSRTCRYTAKGMCDTCSHLCLGGCQNTSTGIVQDTTEIKDDTIKKTTGCMAECHATCYTTCHGGCKVSCMGPCAATCGGKCQGTCHGTCNRQVDLM